MRLRRFGGRRSCPGNACASVTLSFKSATLRVIAAGGQWLPETGRQIDLESNWRIEYGEWVCFRTERR
jgi:hypothetical protein